MNSRTHPVDEILPVPKLFTLGLQHVLVMYAGAIAGNRSNLFIVAISLGFGMIPEVAPNFEMWLPHVIHPLIDSGILLATVSAVLLNAFFNGASGTIEEMRKAAEAVEH